MAKFRMSGTVMSIGLPLVVLLSGVGAGAVIITNKPVVDANPVAPELRTVNAIKVLSERLPVVVESQGTVDSQQRISLVPQVTGIVSWVSDKFVNGGRFTAGEVILRIDDSDYQLAVTSAQANVAEAQQQLETIRAQAEQAEADWALLKRSGAQTTLEPTALALRKPQLTGAQARLLSSEAELQKARLMLARTEISSPFNSMVSNKQVDIGQFVSTGMTLAQLVSSDVLEVRLALPERELDRLDLARLDAGIPLELRRLNGSADDWWEGTLVRSEGMIDVRTRNLTLVAQFTADQLISAQGNVLTIGQFVKADIRGREMSAVVVLPRTALHNGHSVFVVDGEQQLREREVVVLEVYDDRILVQGGLFDGDVVSISPLTSSVEGQHVRVQLNGELL